MDIFGKVESIGATVTGKRQDGSEWARTSFVVKEVSGMYPQSVQFEAFGTAEHLAQEGIVQGAVGLAQFSMSVETWQGKTFNRVRFGRWNPYTADSAHTQQPAVTAPQAEPTQADVVAATTQEAEGKDGLPF